MAKVKVVYTVQAVQTLDWPDDEMDDFDYHNLECNLEPNDFGTELTVDEITDVTVNGEVYEF